MDKFLQQLLNRFLGRFLNQAIGKGIDYAARRGKDPAEMSEAERQQARSARDLAGKARKVQRASRKLF